MKGRVKRGFGQFVFLACICRALCECLDNVWRVGHHIFLGCLPRLHLQHWKASRRRSHVCFQDRIGPGRGPAGVIVAVSNYLTIRCEFSLTRMNRSIVCAGDANFLSKCCCIQSWDHET